MRFRRSILAVLLVFLCLPAFAATRSICRVPFHPMTVDELGRIPHDGRRVFLQSGVFDPTVEAPDFTEAALDQGEPTDYAIVQFNRNGLGAKALLERFGVRFFGYLPDNSFQAKVPAGLRAELRSDPAVRWVGEYLPGYKVHPRLWPGSKDPGVNVTIRVFPDASIAKVALLLRSRYPEAVQNQLRENSVAPLARFTVPRAQRDAFVQDAARMSDVSWIEPYSKIVPDNIDSSGPIQGNADGAPGRTIFSHGITGTGEIVAVSDSGLDDDMCFFRNSSDIDSVTPATRTLPPDIGPMFPTRKVLAYWVQPGADPYDTSSSHGTHTSGTVAGDNFAHLSNRSDAGIDPGDGMAPNAQLIFQDMGSASGALVADDIFAMFLQSLRGGAGVQSNSWGDCTPGDGSCNGVYKSEDEEVDRFLFDHDEMTVVFSAGNDGAGPTRTGSPGNAKNVITVGALGHGGSLFRASYSSRGPTADGRIKPDIMAPGGTDFAPIQSARGDGIENDGNCGLVGLSGTSMACPAVAGGAALLRQYFSDGFYPSGAANAADVLNPTAPLVKATLLNGTLPDVNGTFGDSNYGWGRIFLDNNLFFKDDSRKLRVWNLQNGDGLKTGQSNAFRVKVGEGQEFRATMVWSDPEATPGAASSLVNNLDLIVTTPDGTYLGNVIGTDSDSASGGSADAKNNVEQVRFAAPKGGVYTIIVNGTRVPGNGRSRTDRQGYALVASYATCTGAVSSAPANLAARSNASMGVDLAWTPASGSTVTQVYRAKGRSVTAAEFQYVGTATGSTFTDARAQGGETYSYEVRGGDDCGEGPASSTVTITATGSCDVLPEFAGAATASADANNCRILLTWLPAKASCLLGQSVRYNVYRSTSPDLVLSGAPYATVTGTGFRDDSVLSGITYYYVVRAEDGVAGSTGPHGGNEETNGILVYATAFGSPGSLGTWDAGDTNLYLAVQPPWQVTSTDHQSGSRAYHSAPDNGTYPSNTCASISTPELQLGTNAQLDFWARFNLEFQWDGVVIEVSTDDGATWSDLPPTGGYPNTLSQTQNPPVNACGFASSHGAFTGPAGNAGLTDWTEYKASLASYNGSKVKIRWRLTTDPSAAFEGFFLDSISVTNVNLPTSCAPVPTKPVAQFTHYPFSSSMLVVGMPVYFTDQSQFFPTSWQWTFGDGSSSTEQNPAHVFTAAANYTVTLTVTNAQGTSTVSRQVNVTTPGSGSKRKRAVGH